MFNLHLPTVEIIAGDTCPFVFNLDNMSHMNISGVRCEAHLSISPYVNDGEDPICTVSQYVIEDGELIFEIPPSASVNLRGKYVYQLYLSDGDQSEIYEGFLIVYANRNKSVIS